MFLKQREKQIRIERPEYAVLAQQATDALACTVTRDNLKRGLKAAGIEYTTRALRAKSNASLERHERVLAALCAKLGEDMEALAAT
jgi:hypothetical protein